jgi:hypothetical protein
MIKICSFLLLAVFISEPTLAVGEDLKVFCVDYLTRTNSDVVKQPERDAYCGCWAKKLGLAFKKHPESIEVIKKFYNSDKYDVSTQDTIQAEADIARKCLEQTSPKKLQKK